MSFISPEDMNEHIKAGRAEPWTSPLGPDQEVLPAARMDGIWYVVVDGTPGYQPAPPQLDELLTDGLNDLNALDARIGAVTASIENGHTITAQREVDQGIGTS